MLWKSRGIRYNGPYNQFHCRVSKLVWEYHIWPEIRPIKSSDAIQAFYRSIGETSLLFPDG